jgi:hypothetical protein
MYKIGVLFEDKKNTFLGENNRKCPIKMLLFIYKKEKKNK